MPLYEISPDGLVPFRQLRGGAELYEAEIEQLLWENLDDLTGEVLFPIRRQATIAGGGRPDIVALDNTGAVVVIEVKRDVDRAQLAQCLEYAGWARTTSLDELAGLYHRGADRFWRDWQEFTETDEPVRVARSPRLVLAARDFDGRTNSALTFLLENSLPIKVIQLGLYEDSAGRRFLNLEGVEEPELPAESGDRKRLRRGASVKVSVPDLLGAGLLTADEQLTWLRPRLGESYTCTVTADGRLRLPDGRILSSPSGAAMAVADIVSYDGWYAWRSESRGGVTLAQLRDQYLAAEEAATVPTAPEI
jgi:Restriction Enzyme Adenine Methylase Associated